MVSSQTEENFYALIQYKGNGKRVSEFEGSDCFIHTSLGNKI